MKENKTLLKNHSKKKVFNLLSKFISIAIIN